MANTLTGIIPTLYEAMNVTSREMVGFIPAVKRDSTVTRAAVGQTVRSPIGVSGDLEDITPGVNPAGTGDTTVSYHDVTMTRAKAAPIRWTGEEQLSVTSTGVINNVLVDQFADGMRKLVNAMEVDIALAGANAASRAYGTAGTAPFGTAGDLADFAGAMQILENNGAPKSDLQLALNSASMANLRGKQSVLFKVNEAGSSDMLRNGMTDRVQGFALRNSAGFALHTKGTGASILVNNAAAAVGDTVIPANGGSGTILAGDVITIAGDTNKYVVTSALSGGSLTIAAPGLRVAVADDAAITVGATYTPNLAFARSAIVLATRAPALPEGGDSADDRTTVSDPVTGMTFEVSMYKQYRQVKYEIAAVWGVGVPNPAHIATLLG